MRSGRLRIRGYSHAADDLHPDPCRDSGGFAMIPAGGGIYSFTLLAEDVPGYSAFADAWFQYQFVANDSGGSPILRSAVFGDITLSRCGNK